MSEIINKNLYQHYQAALKKDWAKKSKDRISEKIIAIDINNFSPSEVKKNCYAIIGFSCDEGVKRNNGRPGAYYGPSSLRSELGNYYYLNAPCIYDLGNITCEDENLESAQEALAELIRIAIDLDLKPIIFGGGHETAWGHYLGLTKVTKDKKLAIINFDAHFDLRPTLDGNLGSSGTPFLQIADHQKNHNQNFDYTCIGIQKYANSPKLFSTAKSLHCNYELASNIHNHGIDSSKELIKKAIDRSDYIYLSICLDVFSAAIAPGVSATQVNGLFPNHVLELIRSIIKSDKLLSADIVELSPPWDINNQTSKLAALLALNILEVE